MGWGIFLRRCDWFAGGGEPDKVSDGEGVHQLSYNGSVIGTMFGEGGEEVGRVSDSLCLSKSSFSR